MKANYKVVNNRQAQLKKVIWDFKPTGACAFLMFRYYVMKMKAATDSAKEQGVPLGDYTKLEVEDSVNEFLRDAKDDAISNYVDPDVESEDIIIHFDGTPKEFAKEFEMHVLVAMTSNFEHAFLDFSDINSISRSHFELAVAQFMSAYEREEGKVDNFCNDDKD